MINRHKYTISGVFNNRNLFFQNIELFILKITKINKHENSLPMG